MTRLLFKMHEFRYDPVLAVRMPVEQLGRLELALPIGLLADVERGCEARDVAEGGRIAGIRTYTVSVFWRDLWAAEPSAPRLGVRSHRRSVCGPAFILFEQLE